MGSLGSPFSWQTCLLSDQRSSGVFQFQMSLGVLQTASNRPSFVVCFVVLLVTCPSLELKEIAPEKRPKPKRKGSLLITMLQKAKLDFRECITSESKVKQITPVCYYPTWVLI